MPESSAISVSVKFSRFPVGSTISFYYFTTDLQSTRLEKVLPYSGACDKHPPFCWLLYTSAGPITSAPMMDGVDLDVSQARADLLPDKYDRRRISGVLAIRRLSSRHYKKQMSEGDVCSVWVLLLLLVYSLHHVTHSKPWRSFKRRHWLLVFFVSLPLGFCWKIVKKLLTMVCKTVFKLLTVVCKIVKKLFKPLAAVCGTLAIGYKFYYLLWLFLKWCFLTAELCKQLDYNIGQSQRQSDDMVGSEVTKEPVIHVSCEIFVYSGVGWVWSGSIQLRAAQLVIRQRLVLSGDVELNPGPSEIITDMAS